MKRKGLYILIISLVVSAAVLRNFSVVMEDINDQAKIQEEAVDCFISIAHKLSNSIVLYAEGFMENADSSVDNENIAYYAYDEENEVYYVDYPTEGNGDIDEIAITGKAPPPKDEQNMQELNMVYELGELFKLYYESMPEISWFMYTSENEYVAVYPYISPEEYSYDENHLEKEIYTACTPSENPTRDIVWTSVYEDGGSTGLIFSMNQPIYYEDDFLGVLTIEFSQEVFDSRFQGNHFNYCIVNSYDQIMSTNDKSIEAGLSTVEEQFGVSIEEIEAELQEGSGGFLGGYYVRGLDVDSSDYFHGFVYVPVFVFALEVFEETIPVALSCLILLLVLEIIERRRKSLAELMKTKEEQQKLSISDPLTGLYNRRKFNEDYDSKVKGTKDDIFYIAQADIDYFKRVNDDFGHAVGDHVLVKFSDTMREVVSLKYNDNINFYRIGGEEFFIVFRNLSTEEVLSICEEIRKNVGKADFGFKRSVTVSLGVTRFKTEADLDETYAIVDELLYAAKRNGRNRVETDI